MLTQYSRAFGTVEVDSTFYAIPATPVVEGWRERVPDGFRFALKVPQQITHERRLVEVSDVLGRFLARVSLLEDRLGPLLVQLSPAFSPSAENRRVFQEFVNALPDDYRWGVEFRDERWLVPETLDVLGLKGVALALVDGRWIKRRTTLELCLRPTAHFAYIRWMGPARRFTDYSRVHDTARRELAMWTDALHALRDRVDTVYGYVNNHFQGHAPHSVREFQRMVGQEPVEPVSLREQVEML
jgi:uncharacterized protein YecE (DUF72 family)